MSSEKIKPLMSIFGVLILATCIVGLVMFFKGRLKEEKLNKQADITEVVETTTKKKKDKEKETTTVATTEKTTEVATTEATTTVATTNETTKKTTTTTKRTTTKTTPKVDGLELGNYVCTENCNIVRSINLHDHYCDYSETCTWTYSGNQLVITFQTEYEKGGKIYKDNKTELFEVLPNHKLKRLSARR